MKWGIYPWFEELGVELIHPDDIEAFRKEVNTCKIFLCIEEGEYITLKYNNNYYRVKEKLFSPKPTPKFDFGQMVRIKYSNEEVKITDIMWHFNKQEHFYHVLAGNKKKTRRYFDSELIEL